MLLHERLRKWAQRPPRGSNTCRAAVCTRVVNRSGRDAEVRNSLPRGNKPPRCRILVVCHPRRNLAGLSTCRAPPEPMRMRQAARLAPRMPPNEHKFYFFRKNLQRSQAKRPSRHPIRPLRATIFSGLIRIVRFKFLMHAVGEPIDHIFPARTESAKRQAIGVQRVRRRIGVPTEESRRANAHGRLRRTLRCACAAALIRNCVRRAPGRPGEASRALAMGICDTTYCGRICPATARIFHGFCRHDSGLLSSEVGFLPIIPGTSSSNMVPSFLLSTVYRSALEPFCKVSVRLAYPNAYQTLTGGSR